MYFSATASRFGGITGCTSAFCKGCVYGAEWGVLIIAKQVPLVILHWNVLRKVQMSFTTSIFAIFISEHMDIWLSFICHQKAAQNLAVHFEEAI